MKCQSYMVNFLGGTSGAFLVATLHNIIFGKNTNMQITDSGDVHSYVQSYQTNWDHNSNVGFEMNVDHVYSKLRPINEDIPIVMFDHLSPNFDDYFNIYPNGKCVIVTLFERDWQIHQLFCCLKLEYYFPKNKENLGITANSLDECNVDELKMLFRPISNFVSNFKAETPYDGVIPETYKDKILCVDFHDLIFKKNKTIQNLENFTNCKASQAVFDEYTKYQEIQFAFFDRYLPWLNLRTNIE